MNWIWIGRNFWPLAVGHYLARAVAFASAVLLAREVPPGHLAPYLALVAVAAIVTAVANWGSDNLGIRSIAVGGSVSRTLWRHIASLRLGIIAGGLLAFGLVLLAGGMSLKFLLPIAVALLAFVGRADWMLLAAGEGRAAGGAAVVREVVLLSGLGLIALLGSHDTWTLLWCYAAAEVAWTVASTCCARLHFVRLPDKAIPSVRQLFRDGVPLAIVSVMGLVQNKADVPILSMFRPATEVAGYWAAYTIFFAVAALPSVLANASLAEFTRDAQRPTRAGGMWRLVVLVGGGAGIVSVFVASLGLSILTLAYGPAMRAGAQALPVLCLALPVKAMSTLLGARLVAGGKLRPWGLSFVAAGAVNVLLNLWLIPHYGQVGAAWATVCSEGLLLVGVLLALRAVGGTGAEGRVVGWVVLAAALAITLATSLRNPYTGIALGVVVIALGLSPVLFTVYGNRRSLVAS